MWKSMGLFLGIIHLVRTQAKFSEKTKIYYPLIRTRTCAYQGVRNVSFLENFANFANVLNEPLMKNHLWRSWCWLPYPNWIGALLLKLSLRKSKPWFVLWSFFLLRLLCNSINLPYGHAWNTVVMSGLVLLVATWNCWISYKSWHAGLLVLHLLPLLSSWLIFEM